MRRIVLLLALVAVVAAIVAGSAVPAMAQGMNCAWYWDDWYGWYYWCY
jgi:heme A synthase